MGSVFLGIDQTGAVDKFGHAKPLPCCILKDGRISFHQLKSFSYSEVENLFLSNKSQHANSQPTTSQLTIIVDCVLGVPVAINKKWRDCVQLTLNQPGFGRTSASEFFYQLGNGKIHHRDTEMLCRANSLFREKPFQKNIQTGTFRFWKEMALDPNWFYAPMVRGERGHPSKIPIYEGYPSLSWKIFGEKTRQTKNIKKLLARLPDIWSWTSAHQRLVDQDPNLADALLLALSGKYVLAKEKEILFAENSMLPSEEGYILGQQTFTDKSGLLG
jgi:hypothetical protein